MYEFQTVVYCLYILYTLFVNTSLPFLIIFCHNFFLKLNEKNFKRQDIMQEILSCRGFQVLRALLWCLNNWIDFDEIGKLISYCPFYKYLLNIYLFYFLIVGNSSFIYLFIYYLIEGNAL